MVKKQRQCPKNVTQCLKCGATLGQESRDTDTVFCHEHMACTKCGQRISPIDSRTSYLRFLESLDEDEGESEETSGIREHIEPMHSHCYSLQARDQNVTIRQSDLDTLNQIRLMVTPNMDLNVTSNENEARIHSMVVIESMTIDQLRMHLCMIEACAAWVKATIKQSPEYRREDDRKLEKERFTQPHQSKTNSASAGINNQSLQDAQVVKQSREAALQRFMEVHGITDRYEGKQLLIARTKGARSIMESLKLPEDKAIEMATKLMIESKRLPK